MSKKAIYIVGANGTALSLNSGKHAIAIRPAGKGEKGSYALVEDGSMITIPGQRIQGLGVEKYLASKGYIPAPEGDAAAERLADRIAMREGVSLVEEASRKEASRLQALFGGQACVYVPFDEGKPAQPILVRKPEGFSVVVLGIGSGLSSGSVEGEYLPGEGFSCTTADLGAGWLVGPGKDPEAVPRNSEYGGLVERAVLVLANSGIGTLVGGGLAMDEDAAEDAPFPRGSMALWLGASEDRLVVGINAIDELEVQYLRNDQILAQRTGLDTLNGRLNIGSAIGSIAAVLVRVQDLDAETPARKKKAKAA